MTSCMTFPRDTGQRHQAAAPSRPATPGEQPTLRSALGGQCVLEVVFCVLHSIVSAKRQSVSPVSDEMRKIIYSKDDTQENCLAAG